MKNIIEKKFIYMAVSALFILGGCGGGNTSTITTSSTKADSVIPHSSLSSDVVLPTSATESSTIPHSAADSNIVLPSSTTESDNVVQHSNSDTDVVLPTGV